MKIFSVKEAGDVLDAPDLETFFGGVDWQYKDPVPSYFLEEDSGAKVGLARMLANTFLERRSAVLWITETGIWPSTEHMDLFLRYRASYGETRTVKEAPVHIFEQDDGDAMISIVAIALFFAWGFDLISRDRSLAMTVSHDEWLEYRFAPGHEQFIPYFEKWIAPSLRSD